MSYLVITTSVADLRAKPKAHSGKYIKDLCQETQLLYGEVLEYHSKDNPWFRVNVPDQLVFKQDEWSGYPGWVHKNDVTIVEKLIPPTHIVCTRWAFMEPRLEDQGVPRFLSCGTQVHVKEQDATSCLIQLYNQEMGLVPAYCLRPLANVQQESPEIRTKILQTAYRFEGTPYMWGGRSGYFREYIKTLTGVDCSALVQLCYKVHGVNVPRNAQDQYLISVKKEFKDLKPADLIFLAHKEHPHRIYHVMIYHDGDSFIEATMESNSVRFYTGSQKLGLSLDKIKYGDIVKGNVVYFGSIFK